ncbi:adenosylcobinamide-GDP ribazoletransferase [Aeromicrobium terrae]|uniref:Adenosylcobinamide-GDP ribazoletransferase n=1 Tax=Aeromicrobium terrae TaxID=2498846 RepID=A0A5C8NEK3_9ACTN|nr:adenosylcobinamide-GDP ribazoletransferase [Aeromicrobium terrae]TXL57892.1 adenosylcobinamide-GDP ribazoletransferase [Aeromicrobium terrae]
MRRWVAALRLATGTLTVLPVGTPTRLDRETRGMAMLLAPVAVLPLGALVALVLWAGGRLDVAPLAVGFLAVGALALGSRAFHLDGLADTVDGLTASYDRERSLEVMRTGDVGPAGVVALVVVLGAQAASLAPLTSGRAAIASGVLVCASRVALAATCMRGVRPARPDGLGSGFTQTVPVPVAVAAWAAAAALSSAVVDWAGGTWWHTTLGFVAAAAAVAWLVRRAVSRLGGVTGDVFGAAVELAFLALLVSVYQVQ